MGLVQIEAGERRLLAHIADTMTEAARRSGDWLVCRPGCTECCMGPFAITQLDALRLRRGLCDLEASDAERASRVRGRARAYVDAIAAAGAPADEDGLPQSMDDFACPALDPETGCCDLYSARPITCRTFGPATRTGDGAFAACELCYAGATDEQIAECAVDVDPEGLESELLAALGSAEASAMPIVAYALR
jgi:Fe-S-cluster containining protein